MKDIVYDIARVHGKSSRHTLAVLVDNEFGVLARVIGLFSGRGYNIESLTVAEVEHDKQLSRITIVTSGNEHVIEQIKRLLERMVPVHQVNDLTVEGPHVERELALVVVATTGKKRAQAQKKAEDFGARTASDTKDKLIFEMIGTSRKIDEFLEHMRPFGVVEMARSGVVAIAKETAK
jgi:acetolactate synthase-1/3 small subunit